MKPEETLRKLCLLHGDSLTQKAPWCNGVALLGALAENESAFGERNFPRYEAAYGLGGKFCNRELWLRWGDWAACSYSSWQIMFPVAVELGFRGKPQELWDDEIAIFWVMEYIDKRILARGCTNIEQFADGYNSGSFKDKMVPEKYISKFIFSYASVVERRKIKPGGPNAIETKLS